MKAPLIFWFRQDLRLFDHLALSEASKEGCPIIPLYIFDEGDPWAPGGASQWWLHHSLTSLEKDLKTHGLHLILKRGNPLKILGDLIHHSGASHVFWSRCYEPYARRRDKEIKFTLKEKGITVKSFNDSLLIEPWNHLKSDKNPYQVFTPFWKALLQKGHPPQPLSIPEDLRGFEKDLNSDALASWNLLPTRPDWAREFEGIWNPGETGGRHQLESFLENHLHSYPADRNHPAKKGTSLLSPHLHWGEVSPRTVWHQTQIVMRKISCEQQGLDFLRELAWREFSSHLLYHHPSLPEIPWRPEFKYFPWHQNLKALTAWQRGQTGYPLVDAGMRQLWSTGWMHNRVRMIVASFLVKHLLIPWQEGEAWFWDTLVDADLANNAASWQWVAGSGADASPYFRIFNPVLQGEKFDPEGDYIRQWVPELARLSAQWIHKPFEAPQECLQAAGIVLGENYPQPLVNHKKAREIALASYKALKEPLITL